MSVRSSERLQQKLIVKNLINDSLNTRTSLPFFFSLRAARFGSLARLGSMVKNKFEICIMAEMKNGL